jgi:hypothetical protein
MGVHVAGGFRVDLGALEQASAGINDTLTQLSERKVDDVDCAKSTFGHDDLAGTVSDFCDRWEIGVQNLSKDAEQIQSGLDSCVRAYVSTDSRLKGHMDGLLQRSSGPDPAAT